MIDSKKTSALTVHAIRHYWLVFLIIVVLLVVIALKKLVSEKIPIIKEDFVSEIAQEQVASLDEVEPRERETQIKLLDRSKVEASNDDIELPIPEDVEALVRYYGDEGRKNIRDAEVLWQKRTDKYINFLDKETFEQGLHRTYICSELIFVLGSSPNFSPANHDIIRIFARTRRFSKLISEVRHAKKDNDIERVFESIKATVERFIKERREVEEWFEHVLKEEPEIFSSDASEEQRSRVSERAYGVGATGLGVPDGMISMSLHGTQLSIVSNCFLLGLTEDPRAMAPLLDVISYDSEPLIKKLIDVWVEKGKPWSKSREDGVRHSFNLANHVVVADALDRIFVACSKNETISAETLALAQEYVKWRQNQGFAAKEREVVSVYAYDEPRTPYDLPGSIMGVSKDAKTETLELPLQFGEIRYTLKANEMEDIKQIIEWAKRFIDL